MARETFVTPRGVAVWPRLESPDSKYDSAGIYSVKLRLSSEDGEPLAKVLSARMDHALKEAIEKNAALPKAKQKKNKKKFRLADAPFSQDEETGDYLFNFKMRANVEGKDGKKYSFKPLLVDAKGNVAKNTRVGGGSIIKVSYEVGEFFTMLVGAGVTLRLRGVQVIEYKEYDGADANSLGFEEEEGGWEAPKPEPKKDTEDDADDDADEDGDEDGDDEKEDDNEDF